MLNAFLLVYAGLFPIVNPVGGAPIFLRLTSHVAAADRPALAGAVAINSFMLLLGSLFIGSHVLVFFGLTLPVVRVAGGMVVAAVGWKLLQAGDEGVDRSDADKHGSTVDAFYPLTMPLTVGPGSISVALTLGSQRPSTATGITQLAMIGGGAVAGLLAIAATIYVCYRFAGSLVAVLGERGTNVLMRLSAFILFCIGIQIIWSGLRTLIPVG
ncbi:MAG: MarC family protein [Xanthobacteraceae bacterium]|nr:MarC family protein [Xanthobacteraceae bacterium]